MKTIRGIIAECLLRIALVIMPEPYKGDLAKSIDEYSDRMLARAKLRHGEAKIDEILTRRHSLGTRLDPPNS